MTVNDIIIKTLIKEGFFSNDPTDAGGVTKYGIADNRDGVTDGMVDIDGDKRPDVRVADLTMEQAIEIYKREYYDALGLAQIKNTEVQWKVFDIGVNMGPKIGVKFLQKIVGETQDGVLGPKTAILVNTFVSVDMLKALAGEQIRRYVGIVQREPNQIKYLGGWINRALDY